MLINVHFPGSLLIAKRIIAANREHRMYPRTCEDAFERVYKDLLARYPFASKRIFRDTDSAYAMPDPVFYEEPT